MWIAEKLSRYGLDLRSIRTVAELCMNDADVYTTCTGMSPPAI